MLAKAPKTLIVVTTIAAASGAAAALATASSGPTGAREIKHARRARAREAQVTADLAAGFAALRRPRNSGDALSGVVMQSTMPAQQDTGMDTSQSRLVSTTGGTTAWLVEAARGLCLIVASTNQAGLPAGRVSCSTPATAESDGIVVASESSLIGVLPDGSSAMTLQLSDGSSQQVTPNADGAVAVTSSVPIATYSYTTADGTQHHGSVGVGVAATAATAKVAVAAKH